MHAATRHSYDALPQPATGRPSHGARLKPRAGGAAVRMWAALGAAVLVVLVGIERHGLLARGARGPSLSLVITHANATSGTRNRSAHFSSARLAAASGLASQRRGAAPVPVSGLARIRVQAGRAERAATAPALLEAQRASAAYWDTQRAPRPPKPGEACRRFRVAHRKDFLCTVAPLLTALGLCPSADLSFDVYWGYSLNAVEAYMTRRLGRARVPADAILSSLPLMMQLVGEKPAIAALQQECFRTLYGAGPPGGARPTLATRRWCAFTHPGFNARRERADSPVLLQYGAMRAFAEREHNRTGGFPRLWIVKSIQAYSQQGIKLVALRPDDVRTDRAFASWAERRIPTGDFTIQHYLATPLLWKDRKFDLRVLAMITSVRPLRFYVLDHAFPKIATRPYTTDLGSISDACVHFRMPVCDATVKPYPPSTDSALFRAHLQPALRSDAEWDERLYPALYVTLLKVVLMARRTLLRADRHLCEHGFAHKRVQLLQPDMIFDASGHAHVIEMNTNGFMVGSLHAEFFDATAQMRSALELAGVGRYPLEPKYRQEKASVLGEYCAQQPGGAQHAPAAPAAAAEELAARAIPAHPPRCTAQLADSCAVREGDAISAMLDEWCHAGRWLSVWPPRDGRTFEHVASLYADASQPLLRAELWSEGDGQLLRFSRWLQLDSRQAEGGALAFCGAATQRLVENRTLPAPVCKCEDTERRPSQASTAATLGVKRPGRPDCAVNYGEGGSDAKASHDPRDPISPPELANSAFTARMPVRDMARFPEGYRAEPFDPDVDNTPAFENARKAGFKMAKGKLAGAAEAK